MLVVVLVVVVVFFVVLGATVVVVVVGPPVAFVAAVEPSSTALVIAALIVLGFNDALLSVDDSSTAVLDENAGEIVDVISLFASVDTLEELAMLALVTSVVANEVDSVELDSAAKVHTSNAERRKMQLVTRGIFSFFFFKCRSQQGTRAPD